MAKIVATNKHTGETIELEVNNLPQIIEAWRIAKEYEKVSEAFKSQLKKLVPKYVNDNGESDEYEGYMFRISNIQRMTYDKAIMRRVLDEDAYDQFLKPDKPTIDRFLKENLETLGDTTTELRTNMLPDGVGYQVIKLEKLVRDE